MNKTEMIDKAIDDLGGDINNVNDIIGDYLWLTDGCNYQLLENTVDKFSVFICTRQEFESRKKERQMKEFKPKVGEVCEVTWGAKKRWYECIVGDKATLRKNHDDDWIEVTYEMHQEVEFRPIKSERDKVLKYVDDKWREHNNGVSGSQAREIFAILYDAGMLKLP